MTLIRATNVEMDSGLNLGALARIWKGGCIIRAIFLDHIKQAYDRNLQLANLLVDAETPRVQEKIPLELYLYSREIYAEHFYIAAESLY
ncbi:hypothetical protein Tco_0823025 [Tanacetum coccineum]|uniref:phosphogluconate dehydrogenase (NADP(+)-dependent, decarboxylating) n=1 Tax=Tanacetum coccineum TaxID=301880 RepID=A0ABQ5AHQ1_9ASTR